MGTYKTCGKCAIMASTNGVCPYFNQKFEDEQLACPMYTSIIHTCEICKKLTFDPVIDMTDPEHPHILCHQCQSQSGTCATCVNRNTCSFETSSSQTPKLIQKKIRQGNAVIVTEIPNPERIRETCQKDCPCFDPEFGCLKQNNTCGKWKIVYEKV